MTHGGKRVGAGRPEGSGFTVRRVVALLDAETAELLRSLEADGRSTSEAIRHAIRCAAKANPTRR